MTETSLLKRVDKILSEKFSSEFRYYKPDQVTSPSLNFSNNKVHMDYESAFERYAQEKLRITFEDLDSIRISRGEFFPSKADDSSGWLYRNPASEWLFERCNYELENYKLNMLEEGYSHFLIRFHDEFFEWISKGFWIESIPISSTQVFSRDHPLLPLPVSMNTQPVSLNGKKLIRVINPLSMTELVKRSYLCTQKIVQYYFEEEDNFEPFYYLGIKTFEGKMKLSLQNGKFYPVIYTSSEPNYLLQELDHVVEQYLQNISNRQS